MLVYLDNSATTKVREEVLKEIIEANENYYGNPSSLHRMGLMAEKKIEEARKSSAKLIGARAEEIYFTGGGTESNNIAIFGHLSSLKEDDKIITTKIEHPSVYNVFKQFEGKCTVKYLDTDEKGKINIDDLRDMVDDRTLLVSIMHVNNEIGAVQDLNEIAALIKTKNKNTRFHVDGVQSYGKIKIDVRKTPIDTLSFSSHKIHGPKGVGGLYIRSPLKIGPLVFGGGQERGIRSGTENTSGIIGFGKACDLLYGSFDREVKKLRDLRDIYIKRIEGFGIKYAYLGTSCPVEKLVDAAIETNADAILLSTIITHDDVHIKNMKKVHDLAIEKGIRDKVIIVCGGTQVTNEIAKEAGLDAGFGRGTHGIDVASFLVERRREMNA
jgi:cysteine desulfurase